MTNIAKRLSALEAVARKLDVDGYVVAFMIDGASDDDVIAVRSMHGGHLARSSGETLAELVERVKACQPRAESYVLFFEYSDALRQRLGTEHLPDDLPDTWPIPSFGRACHVEARS